MFLKSILTIFISILVLFCSSSVGAQTLRIKSESIQEGIVTVTEVFEYDYVEVKPEFPGGGNALVKFINDNRQYPHTAYELGIQGRVTCSFVVNPNGKLSHLTILRGVEPSLNNEAIRLISTMPDWNPGKIQDIPVPVRVVCSIPFRK